MAKPKKLVPLSKMSPEARAKRVASLIAQGKSAAVKNSAYLPDDVRKKREAIQFDRTAVTPGSSMTNQDLRRQRHADETLQFGPNAIPKAQERETTVAGWYDDFRKSMQEHAQNVQGYGQQADTRNDQLRTGMGGVGGANTQGLSSENATIAQNAQSVRDSMLRLQGADSAGRSRAANTYADSLANVVAPAAKLGAMKSQSKATQDTKDKIGAWRTAYNTEKIGNESKNVLATTIATGKTTTELAKLAQTALDKRAQRTVQKRGQDITASTAAARLQATKDAAAIKAAEKKDPKPKSPFVSTGQQSTFKTRYVEGLGTARNLKTAGITVDKVKNLLRNGSPATTTSNGTKVPAIPKVGDATAVEAIIDVVFRGGRLTPATVKALHAAGIKVSTLGAPTVTKNGPAKRPSNSVGAGILDGISR